MAKLNVAVALPKHLPFTIHIHNAPKCSGDYHDPSCKGKKDEITCNQVTIFGKKVAVCTHQR